jgi:hypothetical protein
MRKKKTFDGVDIWENWNCIIQYPGMTWRWNTCSSWFMEWWKMINLLCEENVRMKALLQIQASSKCFWITSLIVPFTTSRFPQVFTISSVVAAKGHPINWTWRQRRIRFWFSRCQFETNHISVGRPPRQKRWNHTNLRWWGKWYVSSSNKALGASGGRADLVVVAPPSFGSVRNLKWIEILFPLLFARSFRALPFRQLKLGGPRDKTPFICCFKPFEWNFGLNFLEK